MIRRPRNRWAVVAAILLPCVSSTGCEEAHVLGRPVPTPGPQIAVRESTARDGEDVERGERIRFAVIGTGNGTHFGAGTFLHSPAFTDLQVVALESSARLLAQGTVSLAVGEGWKDVAAVTGGEIAVAPWAFRVRSTDVTKLGRIPCESDAQGGDANVIDPAGDFDVFEMAPPTDAIRDLLVRVDVAADAPADFAPSIELYDARGTLLAGSESRCVVTKVRSRTPLWVRVSDPSALGGPTRRYRVVAAFGNPAACLAAGDLTP